MSDLSTFEIKDSAEIGRYVIAKREFDIGNLIFEEEPLLISPFRNEGIHLSDNNLSSKSALECVGCYKILLSDDFNVCSRCKWPICCDTCINGSLHSKYECSLFEEKKIAVSSEIYWHIGILRAVLMSRDDNNRSLWDQLNSLSSTFNLKENEYMAKHEQEIESVTQFFKLRFQMNVDPKIIAQVIGAFKVNRFEMNAIDQDGSSYRAQALYTVGSLFSHNCSANSDWVISPSNYTGVKRWNFRIYARRKIFCGDTISISYIEDCLTLGTAARKEYITTCFNFDCRCQRCCDDTDLFFYTEAVNCQYCNKENLTADSPFDELSSWTCKHCKRCSEYSYAKTCVEMFKIALRYVMDTQSHSALDLLITSSNNRFGLGENHREIIYAIFLWIQCLSKELFHVLIDPTESATLFVKFMKRALICLQSFRMFGKTCYIVEIECCVARAIAAYYFKTTDFCSIQYDQYLEDEKKQIIVAICAHLTIAFDSETVNPCKSPGYVPLEDILIAGYNFWVNELDGLIDDDECTDSSSNESSEDEGVNKASEPKSLLIDRNQRSTKAEHVIMSPEPLKEAVEIDEKAGSQFSDLSPFDIVSSPHYSNSLIMKPSIAPLKEAVEIDEKAGSQSSDLSPFDIVSSPDNSNSLTIKPSIALLHKLDFYF